MSEGDIIWASGDLTAQVFVYVLIINDRHTDPEVQVFTTPDAAVAEAAREAEERDWVTDGLLSELPEGWLFAANHPTESDTLQVVTSELRA